MESYFSINNLQQLKTNLLTLQTTKDEIATFIQNLKDYDDFSNSDIKALLLEICYLLSLMEIDIPLVKLTLQAFMSRVILNGEETPAKKNCACATAPEARFSPLQQEIVNKYSPFPNDGRLALPRPGEFGNVQFTASGLASSSSEYSCDVSIDHEGNIIRFLRGPVEIISNQNYEAIYAGLVGKLLEYQK